MAAVSCIWIILFYAILFYLDHSVVLDGFNTIHSATSAVAHTADNACTQTSTIRQPNIASMLGQRCRRWPNIETVLDQHNLLRETSYQCRRPIQTPNGDACKPVCSYLFNPY